MLIGLSGYEERLPGGEAAGRHPSSFDFEQLHRGTLVELEHTPRWDVAREIAMDHLAEDPRYYEKLARVHVDGFGGCSGGRCRCGGRCGGAVGATPQDPGTGVLAVAIGVGLIVAGALLTRRERGPLL